MSDRELRRREFLELLGGLVVLASTGEVLGQESGRGGAAGAAASDLSAWLHVAEDGTVTVYTGKVEIGQNIRTSLAQAVAEELRTPLSSIELVMGDTDRTPFDMGTFGSRTTPTMAPLLRKAAVVAREMLKGLAAERWRAEAASLVVADGRVSDPKRSRSIGFGELTQGRKLVRSLEVGAELTPADRWTVAGRAVTKINGPELVTGRHRYPSDLGRPGMWHGRVLRAPTFGATLVSLDAGAADAMPGVVVVRDGDFAGVAAARVSTAARALSTLEARWKETPQPSGQELFSLLRKGGGSPSRGGPFVVGSVSEAMKTANRRLDATYTVAYIAHVPLEPRAAVAEWSDGRLTVWTGTQRPFGVKSDLAEAFHLAEDRVRVIVPDTGSGYGGKHTAECAIEAARLAKAAGRPVKVAWSREEEFSSAYFRPAGIIDIRSGVDSDGKLVAWEMHNYNSGPSGMRTPYDVPHQRIEFHPAESPLRQGSYRGLAATANHFARESHLDELAAAMGVDPLEMRRRNLKEPRLRAVLDAVAERFGWTARKASPGQGHGIACGTEKGSYVATAAEVQVGDDGKVRVVRLVTAFECGAIVNPDGLRNQVEGSVLMGLGGALFEEVEFDAGRILNPRLSAYRVPRFSDVPKTDVVLLDRKDLPSEGAGETPIVALAPAVAGGIFAATGRRLRALPLAPRGVPKQAAD